MIGKNEANLQGVLRFPNLRQTRNGHTQFTGKMAVPFTYKKNNAEEQGMKYIKISAWGDLAEELGALPDGTALNVRGTVNERQYEGNCKSCGEVQKLTWTDIIVDNYTLV